MIDARPRLARPGRIWNSMIQMTKTSSDMMPSNRAFRLPAQIASDGGWRTGKWHNPRSNLLGPLTVLRRRYLVRHDRRILSSPMTRMNGSMFPGQLRGLAPFQAFLAHHTSTLITLHYRLHRRRVPRLESCLRRMKLQVCLPRLGVSTSWMNPSPGKANCMNRRPLLLRDVKQAAMRWRHRSERSQPTKKAPKRQSLPRRRNSRSHYPRYRLKYLENPKHHRP